MDSQRDDREGTTPADEPAIRRFRHRPMWGCVRFLFWGGMLLLLTLVIAIVGTRWYLASDNFAEYIRKKIETTLENRLGREVTIAKVTVHTGRSSRVILDDIRIANAPGATRPYFATARQVEISGGIESFWSRRVKVGRVDIREPNMYFEVFPAGSKLVHNFPKWKSGPRGRFEIVRLDVSKLYVQKGGFEYLDRKHEIRSVVTDITSEVSPSIKQQIYDGVMTSPNAVIRIQDYKPFTVTMRGGFRFVPNSLELRSIAMRGEGIEAFLSGRIEPLVDVVYKLNVTSRVELTRVRQIFGVEKMLRGQLALSGVLSGKQGDFQLAGEFKIPQLTADVYELEQLRGRLLIDDQSTAVDIESGRYGGGTLSGRYVLSKYAEPYPMRIALDYDRISIEKLFSDWTVENTGLRGAATGSLSYEWEKDRVLEGHGTGNAKLAPGAQAFGNAAYPMPVGGSTNFALDRGVIRFRDSVLTTPKSNIAFSGTLRIEDLASDLALNIKSSDFSELDRIAFNFARSLDKKDFELLGLGGSGTITGTVRGSLSKAPMVDAQITASDTQYSNVNLGDSVISLAYDGARSVLTFRDARFREGDATLSLKGDIGFPEGGGPTFDLVVDAQGYPVARAIQAVDLDFKVDGFATGRLFVTGTPERGKVRFDHVTIAQNDSRLNLNGDVAWLPGEGNVRFDLDIGANGVPVQTIADFLDLGALPVTGDVTGTLHLSGTKQQLEGAGSVIVRNGAIAGEPIEQATADLLFTQGKLRATNIEVRSAAGVITAEADYDFATERFGYMVRSADVDLTKLKTLSGVASMFGGRLRITSSGGGTLTNPELVVEGTLENAFIRGVALPADAPPPTFYLAIRNGEMIVRASGFNLFELEGKGSVAANGDFRGDGQLRILDIARLISIASPSMQITAAGSATVDLTFSGNTQRPEATRVEGVVPQLALGISGHQIAAAEPLRFSYAGGRLNLDTFRLRTDESEFSVGGFIETAGEQRLSLDLRGRVEAALIQLFAPDVQANGHVNVAAHIGGTLKRPLATGTAEIRNAELKIAGFPQLISGIVGTLVFRGDRLEIDSLRANVGGGTVVAGGSVTVDGFTPRRIRINLNAQDVSMRYYEGIALEGDANLLVTGDLEHILLQGDVNVQRALYSKNFDFTESILNLLLERRGVLPAVAASWQDNVALRVHLEAPGTLAVRNNIADVTGTATLDVSGTLANPIVLGTVAIDEGGKVRFQDVDYRVVRGTISFQNPFRIDPYFDITAEGRLQEYELTINLTGTLDRPRPVITSDPPAGDLTILSLLTGQIGANAQNGVLSQQGFGAASTSLLARSLGGFLGSKILPFADAVRIDPGLEASADPSVTFEKRISRDLRVVVSLSQRSQRQSQIVEWQVTPDWVLQLTHLSDRVGGNADTAEYALDGRFRRRYSGRWGGGRDDHRDVALARNETFAPTVRTAESAALEEAVRALPPGTASPIVASIEFVPDTNFDTSALPELVAIKPGQALSVRALQDSIKALFATGDFRDIRVNSTANGATVALRYDLSVNYRLGDITLEGFANTRPRAERELRLRRNNVFSLSAIDRAALDLQRMLNRRGYLDATVDPEVSFDRASNRAAVIFHAAMGQRALVGDVVVEGELAPFTAEEAREASGVKADQPFRVDDARRATDRIARHFIRRGYRRVDARYVGEQYDAATKRVTVRYRVVVGPKVEVKVTGVPRSNVRRWIPFGRNEAYSEDRIDRAHDRIITELQRRGYFFAAVDVDERLVGETYVITFDVRPGQRYQLGRVLFDGNSALKDKQLAAVVSTQPTGGVKRILSALFRRPVGVTQDQLNDDRDELEALYRLQGFSRARVDAARVTPSADGKLEVVFPIVEGPQTIVQSVVVEGNEQVPADELPKQLVREGAPLNPIDLSNDVVNLQTFYGDRGNIEVQVKPSVEHSEDLTRATVIYRVAEGPKVVVNQVIVRGNEYTDTNVITRRARLSQGEPFSYRSMLEAQRELQRLAIFQRVEIEPETADTTAAERNVVIEVEEGRNLTVAGSIGYSTEQGARGSASVSHRNLFGKGRYAGVEVRLGQREQRLFATYREPFTFGTSIPTQITAYREEDSRNSVDVHRTGMFIEASKVLFEQTQWSLRYEYRNVTCSGQLCEDINPDTPRENRSIRISSITPTFFWDKRNDALNPTRGFFVSSSLEYAFPLNSEVARNSSGEIIGQRYADFLKGSAQGAWYLPVTERSIVALSTRLGAVEPFGSATALDQNPVPYSERFFAGGETTHRAFSLDTLGRAYCTQASKDAPCTPFDGADPDGILRIRDGRILSEGGNGLVIVNAEYRFPIFGSLGGALFVDAGNVWRELGQINFGELRYGAGAGVRYITPVGPVRLDFGYKLDREPYEDPFAFFVSFGFPF